MLAKLMFTMVNFKEVKSMGQGRKYNQMEHYTKGNFMTIASMVKENISGLMEAILRVH